jgi:hypothetical protein
MGLLVVQRLGFFAAVGRSYAYVVFNTARGLVYRRGGVYRIGRRAGDLGGWRTDVSSM